MTKTRFLFNFMQFYLHFWRHICNFYAFYAFQLWNDKSREAGDTETKSKAKNANQI